MFGGHKKLYAAGAETEGQVTHFAFENADCRFYQVKVRAKFPDGTSVEFKQSQLNTNDCGTTYEGAIVPVRYDPSDHSKIAVDVPALKARQVQGKAEHQAALDAQFANLSSSGSPAVGLPAGVSGGDALQQLLAAAAAGGGGLVDSSAAATPPARTADPVERLAKLAALKQQGLLTDEQFEAAKAKLLGAV